MTKKTKPTISPEHQRRLTDAKVSLEQAERDLETVFHSLEVTERADKKMIGHALKAAFEKLIAARDELAAIIDEQTPG